MNAILFTTLSLISALASCGDNSTQMLVASPSPYTTLYSADKKTGELKASDFAVRGSSIKVFPDNTIVSDDSTYVEVKSAKSQKYYINKHNLTTDSLQVVQEKRLYARSTVSVLSDTLHSKIGGQIKKGKSVQIVGST